MTKKTEIIFLFALILLPPVFILFSHQFLPNNYFFSSLYKLIFLTPILYRVYSERKSLKKALTQDFKLKTLKKNFSKLLALGLILSFIYFGAFYLFQSYLPLEYIKERLNGDINLNLSNLFLIGSYVIILNSLLEEYFWRSFIFHELHQRLNLKFAYFISALAFSFHHIMFYYDWFSPLFFLLVTLGLTIYSLLMNHLFVKAKDLFSCWLVHAMVDVIQITIGYLIFTNINF